MEKSTVSAEKLNTYSADELINEINCSNLSVLKSIGADDLFNEMVSIGNICGNALNAVCKEPDTSKIRKLAIDFLKPTAPAKMLKKFPQSDGCIVLGFNHPSLGEILRLIYVGLESYPDKEFLFPVNLPWYENLTPYLGEIKRLGIRIVPMITPSLFSKLKALFAEDEEKTQLISKIKKEFEANYRSELKKTAKDNGIIIVAPSATRQATVFPSEEARANKNLLRPTMSFLASTILEDPSVNALFVPVVVFEPILGNRRLNLFKKYMLYPCRSFKSNQVRSLCTSGSKEFDYLFLNRMDRVYKLRKKNL